jgi:hypothetical protein
LKPKTKAGKYGRKGRKYMILKGAGHLVNSDTNATNSLGPSNFYDDSDSLIFRAKEMK